MSSIDIVLYTKFEAMVKELAEMGYTPHDLVKHYEWFKRGQAKGLSAANESGMEELVTCLKEMKAEKHD